MTLAVYALVSPAPRRIGLRGVAGERLRLVTVGTVSAIVGDLSSAPKPTDNNLRAYNRLMEGLAAKTSALLPARFGTQFHDVKELMLVLESRQASLRALLRHVRNRAQMTIRIIVADAPVGRALLGAPKPRSGEGGSGSPDEPKRVRPAGRLGSGSSYLKALADEAARAREIPGFDPVRAAVRRWVRDERVERQGTVATVYHLIPRGSVVAYRTALDRAVDAAGLHARISGPWPAYAFATSL